MPTLNLPTLNKKKKQQLIRVGGHVGALLPLAWLLLRYPDNLGADPVREILLDTGEPALILLILSLAITPLGLFGWKQLFPLRRIFGLYAFLYVALHFLTFIYLDYGLNLAFILDGVLEQNFVLVGFAAFLLLIPLAITSTKGWQRRLGKRWRTLHKLVYLIILLALVHFWWLVKNVYYVPFLYSSIVTLLLLLRWPPVKQRVSHWWRQRKNRRNQSPAQPINTQQER
jgi:sulfoxide reductase heme-binding subunit YedZ